MDHQDISAHVAALEAEVAQLRDEHAVLLRQADLLRRLFELNPAAISYHGRDQRVTMINPALGRIFGREPDALIGHKPGDLFPAYAPLFDSILEPSLERGETFQGRDLEFPDPQRPGRNLIADVAVVPVFDAEGQVEGALLMTVDTTARAEKVRWQAELITQLRALDRSKDEFLGVLSHELRTPLNGIMGFASILADGLAGAINPQQQDFLAKIEESTNRMLRIVDELVITSRMLLGKLTLLAEPIEFPEVAGMVVDRLATAARQKDLVLEDRIPTGLPTVHADPQAVERVLLELVDNAIKFTPPGGRVAVTARKEATHLRCEVTDTGIGVADEDRTRVFDRFYQVDSSPTRAAGGLGLGLAIVLGLVEAAGGEVGVTSVPGKGSTFWFTLPLAEDRAKTGEDRANDSCGHRRKMTPLRKGNP